jgi:hypothetical protein
MTVAVLTTTFAISLRPFAALPERFAAFSDGFTAS